MARAVDTNAAVRMLIGDDPAQTKAVDAVAAAQGVWISHVVLLETAWVLKSVYRKTSAQVLGAIDLLLRTSSVIVESPDVVRAAVALARTNAAIGFPDALFVEVARKAATGPLLTFDTALSKVDGAESIAKKRR